MKSKVELNEIKILINWLNRHIRSQIGTKPSPKIINIFKKNNWLYTGYGYRGIHWGSYYEPYTSPRGRFKINDKYVVSKAFSSWTKNMKIAASFAVVGAYDSFIIHNNPYLTLKQRICKRLKQYGGAGIILKAYIRGGLDIDKAINNIEKNELGNYLLQELPILFESEVVVLKPIMSKVFRHYHPNLCD